MKDFIEWICSCIWLENLNFFQYYFGGRFHRNMIDWKWKFLGFIQRFESIEPIEYIVCKCSLLLSIGKGWHFLLANSKSTWNVLTQKDSTVTGICIVLQQTYVVYSPKNPTGYRHHQTRFNYWPIAKNAVRLDDGTRRRRARWWCWRWRPR